MNSTAQSPGNEQMDRGFSGMSDRLYAELRGIAHQIMFLRPTGETLQPTALLHEAYLRLSHNQKTKEQSWVNHAHFVGAATEAMRRVIIEHARRKKSLRRGGDYVRVGLESVRLPSQAEPELLLALDEAINRLATQHPVKAKVVQLMFFGGLTAIETGKTIGISDRTVKRHWAFARAWLYGELQR